MKTIQTGRKPITPMTLVAILSLSLVVNIPGLAVTPMLDTISRIFPDSTELEIQLLTLLPNVLIIPFVLLSGRMSLSRHKIDIVVAGLVIYTCCAVCYMFASSMVALIIISSLLGIGAGILVPFSTGLLADTFSGKYLVKEMGLQSGISNMTLVVCTYIVGWLGGGNWHMPFAVYLVCLIPLFLTPYLRHIPKEDRNILNTARSAYRGLSHKVNEAKAESQVSEAIAFKAGEDANKAVANAKAATESSGHSASGDYKPDKPVRYRASGFSASRTVQTFFVYFSITFLVIIISYYTPFLAAHRGWHESMTGTITALFFLSMFLPGFCLSYIVRGLKGATNIVCAASIMTGLGLMAFVHAEWGACLGAFLSGAGYGTMQPMIYDKSTRIVNLPGKATLALSIVLSANYISIVLTPFITEMFETMLPIKNASLFPFIINFILAGVFLLCTLVFRASFIFTVPEYYYGVARRETDQ